MRNLLLISLAALINTNSITHSTNLKKILNSQSLASASPTQPQYRVIAHFFGYFDALLAIKLDNDLLFAIKYVEQIVESVPAEERGPASATLQAYVNRAKQLRQRGSNQEKFDHLKSTEGVFKSLQSQLTGYEMIMLGLDGLEDECRQEEEKHHKRFVEGVTQMKAKLTPATVARESELFGVIEELIHSKFYYDDPRIKRFLNFKNRY